MGTFNERLMINNILDKKHMKRIITTLTIVTLLTACGSQVSPVSHQEGKEYAVIYGKLLDFSVPKMQLIHNNEVIKDIPVGNDDTFRDTIYTIANDHTYYLSYPMLLPLYIDKGTNIELFIRLEQSKVTISGVHAEQTQYLIEKNHFWQKEIANSDTLFQQEPREFKKNLRTCFDKLKTKLEGYKFEKNFLRNQQNWIEYSYIYALIVYPDRYKFFTNKKVELPEDFYAERDKIDFDNAQEFESNDSYRELVKNKYFEQISDPNDPEQIDKFIKQINALKSENIRAYFAENLAPLIKPGNTKNEEILKFVFQNVKDKKVRRETQGSYDKAMKITKGKPAPIFTNYENAQGGTTSLTDLRGKRLYVGIWATWFYPCKAELLALKDLQEKLKGEDIEFVCISVDSDREIWREMVDEIQLKGVQLIADKASESQFIKECGIVELPTFLIIDEKGNIISLNAPHPSDPNIEKVLDRKK